ncbi:MAG: hypothetical protein K6E18_04840, partial [Lachnospiraceae bacterium]|nr:hypothetical protein [Lachnospiraceae bacterium]
DASGAVITYEGIQRDGTDYSSTVAPTKTGSYKVTVFKETDEWDYLGTSELFEITPADISKATVTLASALTYNGKTQEQGVSKVMVGKDVVLEAEYTVSDNSALDAGEYTMRLIAKDTGNYIGEAKKTFTIARKQITPVVTIDKDTFDYTGSEIKPVVTVMEGDTPLPAKDYTVVYADNKEPGTGKVTVKEAADGNYTFADITKTFTIKGEEKLTPTPTTVEKAQNPMTVKGKTVKLKPKAAKKKAKIKGKTAITVKNAKGKVTYKLVSVTNKKFKKCFKLSAKTGQITLKKKLKAGTYKLKIKVTAAGNETYEKAEKTVTVKVKVSKK